MRKLCCRDLPSLRLISLGHCLLPLRLLPSDSVTTRIYHRQGLECLRVGFV
jgi:hypothetical protein